MKADLCIFTLNSAKTRIKGSVKSVAAVAAKYG